VRGIWRLAPGAAAPERLEGPINDGDSPGNPYVTPDGRLLLFTADRPGGHGRGDVWATARAADGAWGAPRNLGPRVNGPDVEFCPSLSPDGRWLLFSRIGYRGEERVRDNVYVIRTDAVPVLRELLTAR
jgi:Tol biopolymer transport system component